MVGNDAVTPATIAAQTRSRARHARALQAGALDCPRPTALMVAGVFSLSSFVLIEPAPFDLLWIGLTIFLASNIRLKVHRDLLLPAAFLCLFALFNVISAMFATDVALMATFMSTTFFLLFLAIVIFGIVGTWPGAANAILAGYCVSSFISTLVSVAAVGGVLPFSIVMFDEYRVQAFYKDPNVYGPSLVISIVYLLTVLEHTSRSLVKSAAIIRSAAITAAILLLLVGVILAASRAAWMNLAVSILLYIGLRAWQTRKRNLVPRLVMAAGVFGLVGTGCLTVISLTDLGGFIDERAGLQGYDAERFGAQRGGIELAHEEPLGVGPGHFEARVGVLGISAHSLYVRTLLENGVLGFVSLVVFFYATLLAAFRSAVSEWRLNGPSAVVAASLVGILVNSAFVDTLHWRSLWMQAGLAWGLYAVCCRRSLEAPLPVTHRDEGAAHG